jgi:hypothetical protein
MKMRSSHRDLSLDQPNHNPGLGVQPCPRLLLRSISDILLYWQPIAGAQRGGDTMRGTRRWACVWLAAWGLALAQPTSAADVISVTVEAKGSAVITKDRKWVWLAENAEVRFSVETTYLEQLYKDDLKFPRSVLRLSIVGAARRILAVHVAEDVLSGKVLGQIIDELNKENAYMGVVVRDHTLRYVLTDGYR